MYEVVEFYESLKHSILLVLRYASTSIFAIEVYAAILFAIAHLDVAFVGVFDGVGGEVGQYLLYASLIERSNERVVWVVFDKLNASLVNTLSQRLTDIVEYLGKVDLLRLNGQSLTNIRCLKDIVDESHQHIAVIADNADELHTVVVIIYYRQQVAEAYDSIKWRTYLVGHVGKECCLHLS